MIFIPASASSGAASYPVSHLVARRPRIRADSRVDASCRRADEAGRLWGGLRIGVYLLPEGAKTWGLFFMALTTVNILYGSLAAVRQRDLKYFTAYSSVSHCGFVLFGISGA